MLFGLSFLRLHWILSRTLKSRSNSSLAFSQSSCVVVLCPVSAILALMRTYLVVLTAKLTDTKLMERHHRHTFNISPLSYGCVPWFPTHQKKCSINHSTNMTLQKSQIFLMVPITTHCWRLLSILVMNKFLCGSSLTPEILHLAYQLMTLVPSSSATRLLGHSLCLITTFLLKKGFGKKKLFPLEQYLTQETFRHGFLLMDAGPGATTTRDWCLST